MRFVKVTKLREDIDERWERYLFVQFDLHDCFVNFLQLLCDSDAIEDLVSLLVLLRVGSIVRLLIETLSLLLERGITLSCTLVERIVEGAGATCTFSNLGSLLFGLLFQFVLLSLLLRQVESCLASPSATQGRVGALNVRTGALAALRPQH